jgi:hypothetical protein
MFKVLSTISLTVLLTACAVPAGQSPYDRLRQSSMNIVNALAESTDSYLKSKSESEALSAAQESLKQSLKDPSSAQFRNVRLVTFGSGKVICGEVNAKNSYGGYVGFKRFVASPYQSETERTGGRYPEIDSLSNTGLNSACGY